MTKIIYLMFCLSVLTANATAVKIEEFSDDKYDRELLLKVYCYEYLDEYRHFSERPPYREVEYKSLSKIQGKYILPQLDRYALLIVSVPPIGGRTGLTEDTWLYYLADLANEMKPLEYLAGPMTAEGWVMADFMYNEWLGPGGYKDYKLDSYSGKYPGIIELELVFNYLYETRYEDISYIYDNDFHIIDNENLPEELTSILTREDKTKLYETLAMRYHKVSKSDELIEYFSFCTWSEYGGELIYWKVKMYNRETIMVKREVIGIMGNYKLLDITVEPPIYGYVGGVDDGIEDAVNVDYDFE